MYFIVQKYWRIRTARKYIEQSTIHELRNVSSDRILNLYNNEEHQQNIKIISYEIIMFGLEYSEFTFIFTIFYVK